MMLIHRDNPSLTKIAPGGFSWTTLFFGGLVPLFRGDLKWFFIMFLVALCTLGISHFVFPFIYNKKYIEMLYCDRYHEILQNLASNNKKYIEKFYFDSYREILRKITYNKKYREVFYGKQGYQYLTNPTIGQLWKRLLLLSEKSYKSYNKQSIQKNNANNDLSKS